MLVHALTLLLALGPAKKGPPPPESEVVLTAEAVERVVLPVPGVTLEVKPWAGELHLSVKGSPKALFAHLKKSAPGMCPDVELRGTTVVLVCETSRLAATLEQAPKGGVLDLRATRGLPYGGTDGSPLRFSYVNASPVLGKCPATTSLAKAECLVSEQKYVEAKAAFLAVSDKPSGFQAMRLGDLALAIDRDAVAALDWYQKAGNRDLFGRMSQERACELVGGCLDRHEPMEVFRSDRVNEPMRTELELRRVRALTLSGRVEEAVALLQERTSARERTPACPVWPTVCEQVSLRAMRSDDLEQQAIGLELYVRLQREAPTTDVSLARVAADVSGALGAPRFGANLLAMLTPVVPPGEMQGHLARVVQLFEQAGDSVRADVVRDYALARLGKKLPSQRVASVSHDAVAPDAHLDALVQASDGDLALAQALTALAQSRAR